MAIGFRIGSVQQCHARQVLLPYFHHNRKQLLHSPVLSNGKQRFGEKAIHFFICITQHHGMVCIGSHAPHTEKNQ